MVDLVNLVMLVILVNLTILVILVNIANIAIRVHHTLFVPEGRRPYLGLMCT